jgi:predicted component of type VI protein secretion system
MTDALERAVKRIRKLPADRQAAAADMLEDFAAEQSAAVYVLSDAENRLIDAAIAELDRGVHATEAEVEAVYAKYRR